MKKKFLRIIVQVFCLFILLGLNTSAAEPKLEAAATQKNVMSLMNTYNKDSAYILQKSIDRGKNILVWWSPDERIIDSIDTAVHEECHGYTFYEYNPFLGEAIYTGNKSSINVNYTKVYPSKEMSRTIPVNLRTFRWDTYVGNPSANLTSDVDGVYGLLDEFTAYYWGMNAELSLYPYLKKVNASVADWKGFISACANGRLAYAEFKYYIMQYLSYAKQKYPDIYKDIIENKNFIKAYTTIEQKFASQITQFETRMLDLKKLLEAQGYGVTIENGFFYVGGSGCGIFQEDYDKLIREINSSKYANILKQSSTSDEQITVAKTTISSVKIQSNGLKVTWKKASGAKGYYVYRKAAGGEYKKVKTTSAVSWTDTTVKNGILYSYKIIPYGKTSSGKIVKAGQSGVKSNAWIQEPKISSLSSSKKKLTVKWGKVSKVSGYELYYSVNKSFRSAKKVSPKASAVKKTLTSLQKGKRYYVRMRAYKKISGKTYYSSWSNVKNIVIQ